MLHSIPILPLPRFNTDRMRPENQPTWEAIREWYREQGYTIAAFYMGHIVQEWERSKHGPKMLLDQLRSPSIRPPRGRKDRPLTNPRRFKWKPFTAR